MKYYLLLFTLLFLIVTKKIAAQTIEQVKDINPSGDSFPWQLIISGDKIFFIASDPVNGGKLWVSEGTTETTKLLGPAGGPAHNVTNLVAYKNKVYFSFDDGVNGEELWVSDGTTAGTKMLNDLYAGSASSFPNGLTVANDRLFFIANNENGERRLYISDGSEGGTIVFRNTFNDHFPGASAFTVFKNNILFISDNGTGSGYGFWETNGVTTTLLKGNVVPGISNSSTELGDKLYLCMQDDISGSELWVTDGTPSGTYLVKNLVADGSGFLGHGNPHTFITYNGKVYFSATDGVHGPELWVTDGTEPGTTMVKDVLPGAVGSQPNASIVFNNKIYFASWELSELWESDGTEAGTHLIKAVPPLTAFAAVWHATMYLISVGTNTIYQSDGTPAGTIPIKLDNTQPVTRYYQYPSDLYFLEYKGALFLQAAAPVTNGYELCKISGGSLPLQLLSFNGQTKNGNDILQWSAANEINTSSFMVEQSENGTSFSVAAKVAASGHTASATNYNYTQKSSLNPGGYYRLKMVDTDGSFTYSPVIKIRRDNGNTIPARYDAAAKRIVMNNDTPGICSWQITNANGSLIKKGESSGTGIIISVSAIVPGTYYFQYSLGHQSKTIGFIVL